VSSQPVFTFIDLCAGIGGLRIPFDRKYKGSLKGSCVFTSEKDQHARDTYADNFDVGRSPFDSLHEIDEDFTRITDEFLVDLETNPKALLKVPDHDLLLAGFPCQPFSHAGLKRGFEDTRGTLFFSIATIISELRPKVVLLENVRGLKSHDGGNTLKRILEILREPGLGHKKNAAAKYYVPDPIVLNARDFGLPQNRQRIFIVAIREDLMGKGKFEWPKPTHNREELRLESVLDLDVPKKYTISDRLWEGHENRKRRNLEAGKGFGYQLFKPESPYVATISARYYKDGSEALVKQARKNPRKLTPNEIRKLQGFPENFKLHPSDIQAYKQLGNAVPVPVISAIAKELKKFLY
jgi:DNA (cytosine-5)-methyltransferase 1